MVNKVKLELTVDEFHAIINLLATIPANNSYYSLKVLKDSGDAQVEEIKKEVKKAKEQEACAEQAAETQA